MAQKPVLWGEVGCACDAREVSVERGGMGERALRSICGRFVLGAIGPSRPMVRCQRPTGHEHPDALDSELSRQERAAVANHPTRGKQGAPFQARRQRPCKTTTINHNHNNTEEERGKEATSKRLRLSPRSGVEECPMPLQTRAPVFLLASPFKYRRGRRLIG